MMNYYSKLNIEFDPKPLLELFNKSPKILVKESFLEANIDLTLHRPICFDLFREDIVRAELSLFELVKKVDNHINPKNNGLILFPLEGVHRYVFEDNVSVDINQPTLVNGKIIHRYDKITDTCICYAVKVPSDFEWQLAKIFVSDYISN